LAELNYARVARRIGGRISAAIIMIVSLVVNRVMYGCFGLLLWGIRGSMETLYDKQLTGLREWWATKDLNL
jgi:hypothetical protein